MKKVKLLVFLTLLLALSTKGWAQESAVSDNPFIKKWELSAYGGWSHTLAKLSDQIPDELVDYSKRLRAGYHVGADLDYFWQERFGVGLKYVRFNASESTDGMALVDTIGGQPIGRGSMSDDIVLQFIAPSFNFRYIFPSSKVSVQAHYALGYAAYTNQAVLAGQHIKLTAKSLGISMGARITVPVANRLAFMAGASLVGGSFGQMDIHHAGTVQTIKFEETEERENFSRLDVSAGLRLRL